MTNEGPEAPFTELAAAAVQLHEMMLTFEAAGFTPIQAFSLTQATLVAMIPPAVPPTSQQ